jgi:hypothetical protein
MFTSISIAQDEEAVPTRISAKHEQLPNTSTGLGSNFRGPQTVREAMALGSFYNSSDQNEDRKYDLASTTAMDFNIPAVYEQGRGVKFHQINLPWWLVLLVKNYNAQGANDQSFPAKNDPEYQDMLLRMKDWEQRYSTFYDSRGTLQPFAGKETLDPNSPKSKVHAYQSLLFNSIDYEYTKAVARARQGTINCIFNPYIVPGYPMDVLDDSPNCPSFHGVCSSVTHTITSRSIATTVSMVAAVSYSELSMYYTPPLHPTLMSQLGMYNEEGSSEVEPAYKGAGTGSGETSLPTSENYADTSSLGNVASGLLQNPKAKEKADQFYYSVLGIGAADPTDLYDFQVSQPRPQARLYGDYKLEVMPSNDSLGSPEGGDYNDWNTVPGNLRLVSRNIESRAAIEEKFQYTFIDLDPDLYAGDPATYSNPVFYSPRPLEPGASMFLDYKDTTQFVTPIPPKKNTSE